jgi:hypothetical protein
MITGYFTLFKNIIKINILKYYFNLKLPMNFRGKRFLSPTCRLAQQIIAVEASFLVSGFSQLPTVFKGISNVILNTKCAALYQTIFLVFFCHNRSNSVYVILGAHNTSDLSPYAEPTRVACVNVQYFMHPLWNPNTLMGDLAMVKLTENVVFNSTCVTLNLSYKISKWLF